MSESKISRQYKCHNDCIQTGCPGHFLELIYHHTSDTVSINQDNQNWTTFDKRQWRNLINMDEELRNR